MPEWVNAVFEACIADEVAWQKFRDGGLCNRFRLLGEQGSAVRIGHTFMSDPRFGIPHSTHMHSAMRMLTERSSGLRDVWRVDTVSPPAGTKRTLLLVLDGDGIITKSGDGGVHFTWEWMTSWLVQKRNPRDPLEQARTWLRKYLDTKRDMTGVLGPEFESIWFETSVYCWQILGLRREEIVECFSGEALDSHIRPGFKQFLNWLKHERDAVQVEVIINSFGIADFFEAILSALGVRHHIRSIYAARLVFDSQGVICGDDPDTRVLSANKGEVTREAMALLGMTERVDDVIGLGDSVGDRLIAPKHRVQVVMHKEQLLHMPHLFPRHIVAPSWADVVPLVTQFGL